MSSINPPDAPGYTQMYSFGVKVTRNGGSEYMVITVRHMSETLAEKHITAIFAGFWASANLQFFTDMDAWKREAEPDEKVPQ